MPTYGSVARCRRGDGDRGCGGGRRQCGSPVRACRGSKRRCGGWDIRAPGYDQQQGRRCWRALDLGTVRCFLESDVPRANCPEHGPTVAQGHGFSVMLPSSTHGVK
jgi:hypothetical protein